MCQIDKKKYKMNSWKRKGTAGNLMFKLRDEKTKERTIQSGGKRRVPLGQPPPSPLSLQLMRLKGLRNFLFVPKKE